MRVLLDTHAFLWAVAEPEKLSKRPARLGVGQTRRIHRRGAESAEKTNRVRDMNVGAQAARDRDSQ